MSSARTAAADHRMLPDYQQFQSVGFGWWKMKALRPLCSQVLPQRLILFYLNFPVNTAHCTASAAGLDQFRCIQRHPRPLHQRCLAYGLPGFGQLVGYKRHFYPLLESITGFLGESYGPASAGEFNGLHGFDYSAGFGCAGLIHGRGKQKQAIRRLEDESVWLATKALFILFSDLLAGWRHIHGGDSEWGRHRRCQTGVGPASRIGCQTDEIRVSQITVHRRSNYWILEARLDIPFGKGIKEKIQINMESKLAYT